MCGENPGHKARDCHPEGSPPRVRGKPSPHILHRGRRRITPACAGKTLVIGLNITFSGDHPRVCGENIESFAFILSSQGSPPRVRGKQNRCNPPVSRPRITPACAGKTRTCTTTDSSCRDHPRVCGENQDMYDHRQLMQGSPPRVRGKRLFYRAVSERRGITPACAGKTVVVRLVTARERGSPPRVRGKRRPRGRARGLFGITPACAGKTNIRRSGRACKRDHPRVCGENVFPALPAPVVRGSPPRVRGKHFGNGVFPWLILVLSLNPL